MRAARSVGAPCRALCLPPRLPASPPRPSPLPGSWAGGLRGFTAAAAPSTSLSLSSALLSSQGRLFTRRAAGPFVPPFLHVRHSSTETAKEALSLPSTLPSAPPSAPSAVPVVPGDEVAAALPDVTQLGDLHALGLGSYFTPVGWLQNALEYLHVAGGLPWWGSIVVATVVARSLLFPLILVQIRNTTKLNNIKPEMEELTTRMNLAFKDGDRQAAAAYSKELEKLFKKHDCNPLRGLLMPVVQAPIFISFFFGIRKMAELPVASMKTGGALWFTDLTIPDPLYILPVLTASTFLLTVELGTDGVNPQQKAQMKTIFRILAAAMIPITASFPAGLLVYWFTANLFSLHQYLLLKIPGVRAAFKIPEQAALAKESPKPQEGFWDTLKVQYNSQLEAAAKEAEAKKLHLRK